jgi:hypothetical protein
MLNAFNDNQLPKIVRKRKNLNGGGGIFFKNLIPPSEDRSDGDSRPSEAPS